MPSDDYNRLLMLVSMRANCLEKIRRCRPTDLNRAASLNRIYLKLDSAIKSHPDYEYLSNLSDD